MGEVRRTRLGNKVTGEIGILEECDDYRRVYLSGRLVERAFRSINVIEEYLGRLDKYKNCYIDLDRWVVLSPKGFQLEPTKEFWSCYGRFLIGTREYPENNFVLKEYCSRMAELRTSEYNDDGNNIGDKDK